MNGNNPMGANPTFAGAIRGPLMLITLGALFAIDYAGGVSLGRTWPAFLIVLGLLKLAEHFTVGGPAANTGQNSTGGNDPGVNNL